MTYSALTCTFQHSHIGGGYEARLRSAGLWVNTPASAGMALQGLKSAATQVTLGHKAAQERRIAQFLLNCNARRRRGHALHTHCAPAQVGTALEFTQTPRLRTRCITNANHGVWLGA